MKIIITVGREIPWWRKHLQRLQKQILKFKLSKSILIIADDIAVMKHVC